MIDRDNSSLQDRQFIRHRQRSPPMLTGSHGDNDLAVYPRQRWALATATLALTLLLIAARSLEPEPQGFGTHQQLGLPACPSWVLWDARCPMCGMTTAWAWTTRGEWSLAAGANAGGCLMALIALAFVPASCYWLAVNKALPSDRTWWMLGLYLWFALAVAVAQWGWRLLE